MGRGHDLVRWPAEYTWESWAAGEERGATSESACKSVLAFPPHPATWKNPSRTPTWRLTLGSLPHNKTLPSSPQQPNVEFHPFMHPHSQLSPPHIDLLRVSVQVSCYLQFTQTTECRLCLQSILLGINYLCVWRSEGLLGKPFDICCAFVLRGMLSVGEDAPKCFLDLM